MFLYFNERKFIEAPKWTRPLLAFLRTISVAAIAALLLSPFIKTIKEDTQEAIILVAQDNSSSVISEMSDSEVAQFIANSTAMTEKLGTKYETKRISFGEIVKEGSINTFTQQVTNLSSLIDYVNDNYSHKESTVSNFFGIKIIKLPYSLNFLNKIRRFGGILNILKEEQPNLIFLHSIHFNLREAIHYKTKIKGKN